jgi:hypothetical protein
VSEQQTPPALTPEEQRKRNGRVGGLVIGIVVVCLFAVGMGHSAAGGGSGSGGGDYCEQQWQQNQASVLSIRGVDPADSPGVGIVHDQYISSCHSDQKWVGQVYDH